MTNLYNTDIEKSILGSILFNNETFNEVNDIINENDFYSYFHQIIFKNIKKILNENNVIDDKILADELKKQEIFNEELLIEIMTLAPLTTGNIKDYAKRIKELAVKRRLEQLLKKNSINIAKQDTFELVEALKDELENINKENNEQFKLANFSIIENKDIEFILKDFLPIPKKAVTLLSAKGGAGKSWLVLQLALRYINQNPNKKVFAWLSEDPLFATKKRAEKIINEILINDDNIQFCDIDNPNYKNFEFLGSETRPFHFIEYQYKNKKINSMFYKLKYTLKEFDFIILDPLIAFFGGDENDNSQAREFMNLLTEWADKEDKTILVVHHNNKSTAGGIRGASAFVDAVRLQLELLVNEDNNLPNGYRKVSIIKDNWGVERILNKKEIEIKIFPNNLNVNVITQNQNNNIEEKKQEKISFLDL